MTTKEKAWYWGVGFVVFLALLWLLRDVLTPFVAGMAVAYFLDPVCDRLERAGLSRTLATTVVTAIFFVLFAAVIAVLGPLFVGQIAALANALPGYIETLQTSVLPWLASMLERFGIENLQDAQAYAKNFGNDLVRIAGNFLKGIVGGLSALANIVSLAIITPIVAFYLLRDWDKMVARIDALLPLATAGVIREQLRAIDRSMAGFVRGQATVCLLLGIFYGVGLVLVGLDFGFVVGFFTGLVSFVPYFGMLIGFVAGMVLALLQFDTVTPIVLVAVVFGIGQVIEGNFLTPKLVGGQVGLHAVWIIFALMAGGSLFGFLGILLAVPVAAVIGVLIRFSLQQYLASPLYRHGAPPGSD